jgi:hypothetical protein
MQCFVEEGRGIEQQRRHQPGDADQNLRNAERGKRRQSPAKHTARQGAADRQAGHEGGQHRARRIDGDTEDERQPP